MSSAANANFVDTVRAELMTAGMLNSVAGQQALILAEALGSGNETAAGRSAVSKELSRVLTSALRGVHVTGDPIDELRKRRDMKRTRP